MTLFLIPTILAPDTQDAVLPPQIRAVVGELNVFFVEELRTARRFISSLKLSKVIDDITFYELNKDTPHSETLDQLKNLTTAAGIISEAGCPGIADPGAVAVGFAHRLGYKVVPLVGPSSILMALMASGFNGQSFTFNGYLPIDKVLKIKALQAAKEKAKYLLEGIGEQMGEALEIIEIDQSYSPQPVYSNMMMRTARVEASADAMPESNVDVQKIKVRYEMKVSFRIK